MAKDKNETMTEEKDTRGSRRKKERKKERKKGLSIDLVSRSACAERLVNTHTHTHTQTHI